MARRYLEVEVGEKGTILVDVTPSEGVVPAGAGDVIEKMEGTFDDAMDTVHAFAEGFASRISGLAEDICPQEASLEFGILFGGEVGTVVAKASGEANFKVTLTWKQAEAK